MKLLNTIIIEKSYIVSKGLKKVLDETGKFNVIDTVLNNYQLKNLILNHNINIIFINESLKNEFIEILSENINIKLVAITNKSEIINDFFIDFIDVNNEQSKIINKLENISSKHFTKEKSLKIDLTKREITILKYVALGFTTKEIANELFISPHTVVTHRKNLSNRLGIKTVSGLTIYAVLNNIIDINEAK